MENAINHTSQQLIAPSEIESELMLLWQKLAKENKTRASLFNLIVFHHLSPRTDYVRSTVQKIVSLFPCRILFITYDPHATTPYLKTAISVVTPMGRDSSIACDQIDIGVGAPASLEPVPSLLLPHLIPDLPIYLLWTEDPTQPHPLFTPLVSLATRAIFDSETTCDLVAFATTLLNLKKKQGIDIGDLNWARTEGWRDLIASLFSLSEKRKHLNQISVVRLIYNERPTASFCHLKIQSLYLLSWLSNRLKWSFQGVNSSLYFQFDRVDAKIEATTWEKLGSGTVIGVHLHTKEGYLFRAERIPSSYHQVKVEISTPEKCDLPYPFMMGKTATGQSLVKEICTQGTSEHYLEMLETLKILDQDRRI
ncbi:MAG: glucose-6-phosphate dehydrogenase assembly protein OpcA [Chlamydiia bacterium]|nr:glucose-6-phosphate dehydrogenase assembly protein OpcA [Chlamydiia bacterium]